MNTMRERAAPGKHHPHDGPPRLNSSRCGNNHIAASGLNQSTSGENRIAHSQKGDKMSQEVAKRNEEFAVIEQVVMQGDLSKLNPEQRVQYYRKVCESAGLNPFTNPFAYIYLNGKLTLYAKKDCTEQLRKIHGVSVEGLDDKVVEDLYIVKAKVKDKTGRTDESTGAVVIGNLKGEAKANAIMKAETKAKRRATLSICGMGWTDESEIDSIPNAQRVDVDLSTGEIRNPGQPKQTPVVVIDQNKPKLTFEQASELEIILDECDVKYRNWVYDYVKKTFGTEDLSGVTSDMYERMKAAASKNMEQHYEKQRAEAQPELIAAEIQ